MQAALKKLKFALFAVPYLLTTGHADNPIIQTSYTADPAPMVYNDTCYLYTSHDEDVTVNNFYTMNDWKLYSTVDMVNWRDHGTVAGLKTFSWSTDNAWAPQAVPRNGNIYLYVPLNNNTGAKIGVCVADNPAGPFKDPVGRAIAQEGSMAIDPTVFVDDDGQAYLFWGNGNLRMVRLKEDMISTTGSVISNISMQGFTEGPWFYKRESLYYLVYAGSGEKISYATSKTPTGPWTYKGDIFGKPSIATNHPGVVDYKGHSYCFYHNGALPGGGSFKRSVCVEEFTYKDDGTIPALSQTKEGPAQVGSLNPYDTIQAETICFEKGIKTEPCSEGGMQVSQIENGDYIKVKGVDFSTDATKFSARVASATGGGKIELHLDSEGGKLIGTCDVKGTGGRDKWETVTCDVTEASGKKDLYLKFTGGSGELFTFNWWFFTPTGTGLTYTTTRTPGSPAISATVNNSLSLLRLDFSQPVLHKDLTVDLLDLTGRRIATLFAGRVTSSPFSVPLTGKKNWSGAYILRISIDGTTALTEKITVK